MKREKIILTKGRNWKNWISKRENIVKISSNFHPLLIDSML